MNAVNTGGKDPGWVAKNIKNPEIHRLTEDGKHTLCGISPLDDPEDHWWLAAAPVTCKDCLKIMSSKEYIEVVRLAWVKVVEDIRRKIVGVNALSYIGEDAEQVNSDTLTKLDSVRLDSLLAKLAIIQAEGIEGDVVEAGGWRGGASILLTAWLEAHGDTRSVWMCDSFAGFPPGSEPEQIGHLAVSRDTVERNIIETLGSIPPTLHLVEGAFADTLPWLETPQGISLLHFDGDSPMATRDVLSWLYPRVNEGGFIVIDDYCLPACRVALHAWLNDHKVAAQLINPYTELPVKEGEVRCGTWWRK